MLDDILVMKPVEEAAAALHASKYKFALMPIDGMKVLFLCRCGHTTAAFVREGTFSTVLGDIVRLDRGVDQAIAWIQKLFPRAKVVYE